MLPTVFMTSCTTKAAVLEGKMAVAEEHRHATKELGGVGVSETGRD